MVFSNHINTKRKNISIVLTLNFLCGCFLGFLYDHCFFNSCMTEVLLLQSNNNNADLPLKQKEGKKDVCSAIFITKKMNENYSHQNF